MVDTKYGVNLVAELHSGHYYQQVHSTLCHDGGGAATWVLLKTENNVPIVLNPKETVSNGN